MKLFVWDFHGVLEKDNEKAVLEISNITLENYGYRERFTEEEIDCLYGLKWWEYFKYLLLNESHKKHLELQEACFYFQNSLDIIRKYIKPNDNALYVLEEIVRAGHHQILISNTNPEALEMFIDAVGMGKYFKKKKKKNSIAIDMHRKKGKTKNDALKEFIKDKSFDEIIIIGDSLQDMELKGIIGGKAYLYSHKERKFRECKADYYIRDLREILKEL